jgi:hypothetical protein
MLPIKHKSIFKSRWIALLWANGVDGDAAQMQAVANALGN